MCIVRHKEADDHCIPSPNQWDIGPVAWLNEGNVKMSRQEWDQNLKFCVLCYRGSPHTATGFSPCTWITHEEPLGSNKGGMDGGELSRVNAVDWVANLRESFTRLYSQASRREGEYKEMTKLKYDEKTKPRAFAPGDMVLIHNPTSSGKLRGKG